MGVLTTGYLMVNSWTDWRRKEVDIVWTVAVFVLTAFIYVGTDQKLCWSGLLPGICLWLASLWRSDQIGSGDGIVLMGIGWIQGNTAGMCDFSDSDSSGGSGWGLHVGIGNGKKKGTSFCTVFIGRISGAVYLRTGNR